jgi:DNA/RNA-binding domain of Phe-tRNA-synthetase-like protein
LVVTGDLEVRHAAGDEDYLTFSGTTENPEPGEVIYADTANRAHARRWCNRQSGRSAIRPATSRVLIVAEALHTSAADDVAALMKTLSDAVAGIWQLEPTSAVLSESSRRFTV